MFGSSAAASFNDGRFHHFAVARSNGQVTYYKDGYAAGTVASATPMNAQNIYIGTSTTGGEQFEGLIDELAFYNRALSPTEVRTIFVQRDDGKCDTVTHRPAPNHVADYRFDNTLTSSVRQGARIRVFDSALAPEGVATLDRLTSATNNGVPDIALSATNLNFGNVAISNSSDLTLAVSNVGASTFTITSLTLAPPIPWATISNVGVSGGLFQATVGVTNKSSFFQLVKPWQGVRCKQKTWTE
ncbi:MAG: LamG domain-containing protein [Pedosphaera sp.]|nr:LamG domain-containing protein [Pedosphaera sp.]